MKVRTTVAAASLALAMVCGTVGAQSRNADWKLAMHSTPGLPDGIDGKGVGCVVLGMGVLKDGSVVQPMVLQGAFNGWVTEAQRRRFSEAAIEAARTWRFRFAGKGKPMPGYVMHTVDLAGGESSRAQVETLRESCRVDDLAAWGERNAIPVDKATELHGDRVALPDEDSPDLWLSSRFEPPGYPSAAVRAGYSACVVVGFVVGSDGRTSQFKVVSSRSFEAPKPQRTMFEDASLVAAASWTYSPSPINLRRMPQFMQVPVDFAIDGGSAPPCEELSPEVMVQEVPGLPEPS
ncbi:energy transducer TonB [Lysobacter sp. F6437]|uniref:energy transducer TonB n=1 Tax=Lysobacter sp. F6437 TaxID=3459296 RepID=UPI00403DB381